MFDEVESVNKIPVIASCLLFALLIFLAYYFFGKNEQPCPKVIVGEADRDKEEVRNEIYAEVAGAVIEPGVYEIEEGDRVVDLIGLAEGFSKSANMMWVARKVNLSEKISDSQKIYVPFEWEDGVGEGKAIEPFDGGGEEPGQDKGKVNVNTGSIEELKGIKGIGDAYAQRIIENRPYEDFSDFVDASEVPAGVLEKIQDEISFQ